MSHLKITEAVPLGYALVARVAHDAGVRALCIKGPRSVEQGWREWHTSKDVDVLVHPADAAAFQSALFKAGWSDATTDPAHFIVEPHSRQFRHEHWPIEMDVHVRFPGLLRDNTEVFELLWGRRVTLTSASAPYSTVDDAAAQLIEWLHALREPKLKVKQLRHLRANYDIYAHEQIRWLARQTGSAEILSKDFGHMTSEPPVDDEELQLWYLRAEVSHQPLVEFVFSWRQSDFSRRRAMLRRARQRQAFVEDRTIILGASPARARARWYRLRRVAQLPGAVLRLRRAQRIVKSRGS